MLITVFDPVTGHLIGNNKGHYLTEYQLNSVYTVASVESCVDDDQGGDCYPYANSGSSALTPSELHKRSLIVADNGYYNGLYIIICDDYGVCREAYTYFYYGPIETNPW